MTIAFPRSDILTSIKYADQVWTLVSRQEYSRQANGVTRAKDFGSALWNAQYTTAPLPNDDAIAFEAALNSLDGVINSFYAGDLRRIYPRAHADGNFTDSAKIASIGGDGKSLSLNTLAAGFQLSVGDYLSFDYGTGPSRALHQLVEAVTANGSGVTPIFEVRPYLQPGATTGTAVTMKRPAAAMVLMPASIQPKIQSGVFTAISFQAIQLL